MDVGWHVTVEAARTNLLSLHSARAGYCCSIAALLVFFSCQNLQNATAEGETRTISFHHIHTGEDLTVTYKVNGRYDEEALRKINSELRDWRESETVTMDPHLIDLLWEVHREVGAKEPIWVVCGYRSPETNSMLRRRSSGVAKYSQHMLGKAVDFYIPGVPLEQLRAAGLRAQRGGVGFYPTSGSPFVHLDTGSVRHWPRMPEEQLIAVLSKGPLNSRLASDGKATSVAQGSSMPSFLARLFGGGKDEEEDAETAASSKPASGSRTAGSRTTKPAAAETRVVKVAAVPLPLAKPAYQAASYQVASADSRPVAKFADRYQVASAGAVTVAAPAKVASAGARTVRLAQATGATQTDASANEVINARGYWRGLPDLADAPPVGAPRAPAPAAARAAASVEPAAAAESTTPWALIDRNSNEPIPNALAYAAQPTPIAAARALTLPAATARAAPAGSAETTLGIKRSDDRALTTAPTRAASVVRVGDRFNDPWMRAMIVSPSAQNFLRTTLLGAPDFRNLSPYLRKPATTMLMTFSTDPNHGITSEKFYGSAVVFMSTATFNTASLR
jgi:uncharacterized protein YcbK (DUF882 family)